MKAIAIAGIVIAVVALTATGVGIAANAGLIGAAAGSGAAAAGAATSAAIASTALTVGTYASLAAGALSIVSAVAFKPKFTQQGSQTSFATNPQSGLPYPIGRTRMSGLRIFAETNSRPGYTKFDDLLWFGVLLGACGQIHSIEQFKADGVAYTFDGSGNVLGEYRDYMAQRLHLGGPQASAIALSLGGGTAPGWTSAHKLSGMTHAMWCLRFNKQGELFPSGVPEPAWIGKWALCYDPRKDSTYPGGSGSHRALDESTYEWTSNGALHALTWTLGRWQNGKRTLGIGAPVQNIRVSDFVEAANVADANGWKCGGVEWSSDSKLDILKRMLQSAGAEYTKTGAMIGCRVNAPRIPIATITGPELLDSLSIATTKPRTARFNTAIPRFRDEESDWQVVSGSPVSFAAYVTADGRPRTKEIDLPLVQREAGEDPLQAAQLAAYEIVNSREAGPITFTAGPEWIGLKTGDCIILDVPEEGLDAQPILLHEVALDPASGRVSFTAETETTGKHALALGQTTVAPPPFSLTPPDLTPPAPDAALWSVTGTTTGAGYPALLVSGASEWPGADSILIRYRIVGTADWQDAGKFPSANIIRQVISPLSGGAEYEVGIAYQSEERIGPYTTLTAVTTPSDGLEILIADAVAAADGKRAIFYQEAAPSAAESEQNDMWIRKSTGRTYIRLAGTGRISIGGNAITLAGDHILLPWTEASDQRIGQALLDAAGAQATADGKVQAYTMFSASDPEPVAEGFGDLLYRLYTSPPQVDQWSGVAWVPIATYGATAAQIAAIGDALTAAENAQAVADGKVETYYQTTMPTGASEGDLWFDVDDGNKLYRHNGTTFVVTQDTGIASAITAAAGAQATADGKVTTFLGETTPTATALGDLWYRASTKVLSRWSGAAWVATATAGAPSGTPVGSITADDVAGTINSGGGVAPDQVNTPAIAVGAAGSSSTAGPSSGSITSGYGTKQSITYTPYDANSTLVLMISGVATAADSPVPNIYRARLRRDGSVDDIPAFIITTAQSGTPQPKSFSAIGKVSGLTGSHTWELALSADSNQTAGHDPAGYDNLVFIILELKKAS